MASKTVRTPIPTNVAEQLRLAAKVLAKHEADGKTSPLNAIAEWAGVGPTIGEAVNLQDQIETMEKKLEQLYEQRNLKLPGILDVTRRSRALLAAIFKKAPRTLGEWGYTVDDTPRAPKVAKPGT